MAMVASHVATYRLSPSYSPIWGSSTSQNLPDCLFLALVQGSSASCQPGEEDFRRFGHKFPRQVTGQSSKSPHICIIDLKSIHSLHTQPASAPQGNNQAPFVLCL